MPMNPKIHSGLNPSLSEAVQLRGSANERDETVAHIREKVQMIDADEALFGVLSSGERIAVAIVLDRYDLIQRAWGTIAEAVYRLGPQWTEAALRVQRDGWRDEQENTTP